MSKRSAMDKQNETYEEQFQRFYDKYKNRRTAATKLHDAFTEYFQCLLELPKLRRDALESIASSLESEWKDFPELQDQSGKSVRNAEHFSKKLLNHLGDITEESVSSCEEEIAEKESLFDQMAKVKQDIEFATADKDTNKELIDSYKDQLADLENLTLEKTHQLKKKLSKMYIRDKKTFRKFFQVWFAKEESYHQRDYEILAKIEMILDGLPKRMNRLSCFLIHSEQV